MNQRNINTLCDAFAQLTEDKAEGSVINLVGLAIRRAARMYTFNPKSDSNFHVRETKRLFQDEGKVAAIEYVRTNFPSCTDFREAKDFTEDICRGLYAQGYSYREGDCPR